MSYQRTTKVITCCLDCFVFKPQVVDWILGPGEKLLASQSDIGDSFETAEVLRKRHEELEIKCTVSVIITHLERIKV